MIDDFDNLVNPKTLARHCLGPKPSPFVLRTIKIKEKSSLAFKFSSFFPFSPFCCCCCCFFFFFFFFFTHTFGHVEMTTKFNREMYAKIKAKQNEPLSSLGKKVVQVIEKGTPITPATSVPNAMRMAFPATSLEELTSPSKR